MKKVFWLLFKDSFRNKYFSPINLRDRDIFTTKKEIKGNNPPNTACPEIGLQQFSSSVAGPDFSRGDSVGGRGL